MKRKKSVLAISISSLVFICIFSAIYFPIILREPVALNKAKKSAVEYIENKYGITASIKNARLDSGVTAIAFPIPVFVHNKTSEYALVNMVYGNDEFDVYISSKEKNSSDGYDNYQSKQILEYLTEKIENTVPGMYKLLFYGNGVATMNLGSECNMMFQHYFDGTNISELLSERSCKIRAAYINTDFTQYKHELKNSEELSELKNFREYDYEITLVSWISEEAVNSNNFLSRTEYLENTDGYYDVPYDLFYKDNVFQR